LRFFLFSFVSRPSKAAGNPVMNHASILGLTREATSFFCIFLFCDVGMTLAGEQKPCQAPGKYRKKPLDFFGAPLFVSPWLSTTYARWGPIASSMPSPGWHGSCWRYCQLLIVNKITHFNFVILNIA
jgi:hypothetical protein